jgi:hypothetical protein
MSFNFEQQRFTPESHQLFEPQVSPAVDEMQPGEVRFVYSEQLILGFDRSVWVARYGSTWSDEEMVDMIEDVFRDEEESIGYVRLIMVNEGLIADYSHEDQRDWSSPERRFSKEYGRLIESNPDDYLPVIYMVFNEDELSLLEGVLADNNIDLDDTSVKVLAELAAVRFEDGEEDDVQPA